MLEIDWLWYYRLMLGVFSCPSYLSGLQSGSTVHWFVDRYPNRSSQRKPPIEPRAISFVNVSCGILHTELDPNTTEH